MKILWDKSWGCAIFSQARPSNITFLELMRYFRFHLKTGMR